jgi:hypothetical protein
MGGSLIELAEGSCQPACGRLRHPSLGDEGLASAACGGLRHPHIPMMGVGIISDNSCVVNHLVTVGCKRVFPWIFGASNWFDARRAETFPQQKNPREGRKLRKACMEALPVRGVAVSVVSDERMRCMRICTRR